MYGVKDLTGTTSYPLLVKDPKNVIIDREREREREREVFTFAVAIRDSLPTPHICINQVENVAISAPQQKQSLNLLKCFFKVLLCNESSISCVPYLDI